MGEMCLPSNVRGCILIHTLKVGMGDSDRTEAIDNASHNVIPA